MKLNARLINVTRTCPTQPSLVRAPLLWLLLLQLVAASAADKNGVAPNSISLPKGPGSIEGLGESFQPTLNTGTAKYTLGLKVPPGTAGHQPTLSLSYEGGGGNGPLGFGWNLRLPHIQRRTDKGIPTYGEDLGVPRPDTFINELKEELVPQTNGFFFCENEGAFVRYQRVGDSWVGTAPNGTRLEFGVTAAGRIAELETARIFSWLLERETDTRGNVIEYVYRSFPRETNAQQKYLVLIRYGPGAPPWNRYHFIACAYEDRPDWFEDARAGFLVRTGKRLQSITVGTQGVELPNHSSGDFNADGTPDFLNRRYDLAYLQYAGTNSHWSLLASVTLVGADAVTRLPPATFDYSVSNPPDELSARNRLWGSRDEPLAVMDNSLVDLVDLNGDGLPDVLKTEAGGGPHRVTLNRGPVGQGDSRAIQWAASVEVDPGPGTAWNFDLASERTHLADMDGNGLADLVHTSLDDRVFFFANQGRLAWGPRQEMTVEDTAPPAPFARPDVRTMDVDFDKRIDIIQSLDLGGGIAYRIWFNLGGNTYAPPVTIEPEGGFDFTLPGVQIIDGNGDRVPDLARIRPGAVLLAAGLGHGRFVEARSLVLPDFTLDDNQVATAKLADLNGDGLADLVLERAAPGQCWYWLNLGNYTFSSRKILVDLPPTLSPQAVVRWADLNGNGTTDLIYADSQSQPRLQMIDIGEHLSGGLVPNLLTRIDNGIGRVTRITYAPSTRFALEDAANGQPWTDPLPFPVTVVAAMTIADSLGHEYRTEFRYHNGYYDPVEKQFRGFGEAEQIEIGDVTAPTLVTRSQFDTGQLFEAMKGRLLRTTLQTEDGQTFSEESTTWANPPRTLMTGTNGVAVRFAHPVASAKLILELGQGTPRRIESEFDYDDLGNQTRWAQYGLVEGLNRSAYDDERITLTQYALNVAAWIIHLPFRQTIQDENGLGIARTESFYDDETFSGNNPGQVTTGNLTLRREWIDPANPQSFVASTRTKFDAFGNPIAIFDPLSGGGGNPGEGHFRQVDYDANFHSYPIRETIHVGQAQSSLVFEARHDPGLATVSAATDFNGQVTTYTYDALARLTRIVKPYDTDALPTVEYDYVVHIPVPLPSAPPTLTEGVVNYIETRQLDSSPGNNGSRQDRYLLSRAYFDGLGRPLMTRQEAEPAPDQSAPRVVVTGAARFNARQQLSTTLNPFFTQRLGSLETLLSFESIEAPEWQGLFHEHGTLQPLRLEAAHQSSFEYDATLRTVKTIHPDGSQARTEFEPLVTRAFDPNDTVPGSPHFNTPLVEFADGLGRLIQVDELVYLNDDGTRSSAVRTWTTRYAYDLNDRLTRITDAQGNVKTMQYDGLKRRTALHDPNAGHSTNRYDAASNLIETIDAKNQRITYTYDGANRVLTENYHDDASPEFSYRRSPDVTYQYDTPPGPVDQGDHTRATARNTRGHLCYVQDPSGEEHTSFDHRGRVEWTVKRVPDPALGLNSPASNLVAYRTAFTYDSMDRVTRMVYPDNDEVTYRYNARNLLETIRGGDSGQVVGHTTFTPSAQLEQLEFGNGLHTRYQYDARLRLIELQTLPRPPQLDSPFLHLAYEMDPVSNLLAIRDQRPATVIPLSHPRRNTQIFAYDDLYRLTQAQYNPAESAPPTDTNAIHYAYDRIGNLVSQMSDIAHVERGVSLTQLGAIRYGGAAGSANRTGRQPSDPPGPHALTEIQNPTRGTRNFEYDANGNLTVMDGLRCTWDFRDRLVAIEDDTMRAQYRYDYTGRRVIKWVTRKPSVSISPDTAP